MTARSRAHSLVGSNPEGRPENDWYPTPPEGTLALLGVEKFYGGIWEPACGDGSMSNVLELAGYNVISTDLEPRGYGDKLNFFAAKTLLAPNIVTNPPFKDMKKFAEHAFFLGCQKLCLFGKLAFLETFDRTEWLKTTPFKYAYVFQRRLTLTRNGIKMKNGGMIAFAWYVWEVGYEGEPVIRWI